ncbi:MAG: hypothetical protein P4M09_30315 [Devosia sp.]|nr:hypothetical protein [Devosia sp.]
MRIRLILAALAAVLLFVLPTASYATLNGVRLTKDQVMTACGSHYEESNGLGGCTIPCAGGKTCDFSCGGDRCSGRASRIVLPSGGLGGHTTPALLLTRREALQFCPAPTVDVGGPGCSIPCDPVYICQIFCGGRPVCTMATEIRHGKVDPEPQNLAPTSGGAISAPAPVIF